LPLSLHLWLGAPGVKQGRVYDSLGVPFGNY
jgi:hypothetical protein